MGGCESSVLDRSSEEEDDDDDADGRDFSRGQDCRLAIAKAWLRLLGVWDTRLVRSLSLLLLVRLRASDFVACGTCSSLSGVGSLLLEEFVTVGRGVGPFEAAM